MKQVRYLVVILLIGLMSVLMGVLVVNAQVADFSTTFTQNANIRATPTAEAERLGVGRAGDAFRIDGRNTDGSWVRGITTNSVVGWVVSGTVNISLDELIALRIVNPATPFTLGGPVAPPAPGGGAGTVEGGIGVIATATANVNVRSGPDTSFRRVAGLRLGDSFNVDGRDSTSGWARGITPSGVVGWVSAVYLAFGPGEFAGLPVVTNDTPFGLGAPGGGGTTDTGETGTTAPPAPPPAPVVTTGPVSGFGLGGHVQSLNEFSANWMRVAGMTWVKKQWRYVDGQLATDALGLIDQIRGAGFRVLLGVVGQSKLDLNNPGYFDRYASFVAGLASLGVDAIEIWNEPNIASEWPEGQINPARYVDLLRVSYNAIKAANPNTLVISGAPAPTGFFGGCSGNGCDDNAYLAGMAAAGAVNYMDCVGVHYNEGIVPPTWTSGDPRGNSGYYTRYFQPMMNVYYNAFGGRRPLCFTEMGYLSGEGYPPLPAGFFWASEVTVAEQAAWLDQAVSIARNSGRVRVFIIWNIDFTVYGEDPQAGYAIIRPDGNCPACFVLGS